MLFSIENYAGIRLQTGHDQPVILAVQSVTGRFGKIPPDSRAVFDAEQPFQQVSFPTKTAPKSVPKILGFGTFDRH